MVEETGRDELETQGAPDRGAAPFVAEKPVFEVEGAEYEMRRLGWDDCFALLALIGDVLREAGVQSSAVASFASEGSLGMAAIGALMSAASTKSDRLLTLAADTLRRRRSDGKTDRLDPGEFRDPDRFPAYWVPRWLTALSAHPDFALFLAELESGKDVFAALGRRLASRLVSTGSSDRPDGRTVI